MVPEATTCRTIVVAFGSGRAGDFRLPPGVCPTTVLQRPIGCKLFADIQLIPLGIMSIMKRFFPALAAWAALLSIAAPATAAAADIGCVSTTWRIVNNDKVCVQSFSDPQIEGVTCHLSYAKTGGVSGALGFAENPSRFALSCRQTGPLKAAQPVRKVQEDVFTQRMSFLFKGLNVSRLIDTENNSLIYLVVSEKLIDGSPYNSISVVPLMPWGDTEPAITFK